MKYIKKYENKKPLWVIRTDSPYLEVSIDKLNLPEKQKEYLLNNSFIGGNKPYYEYDKIIKFNKIYISPNITTFWDAYQKGFENDLSKEQIDKYEYKGIINITKEDIEKWKLKNDAERYNL